jgi:hypothetical protein
MNMYRFTNLELNEKTVMLQIQPYVKAIAIEVSDFSSQIIDEKNFARDDRKGIADFKSLYDRSENYIVVEIEM